MFSDTGFLQHSSSAPPSTCFGWSINALSTTNGMSLSFFSGHKSSSSGHDDRSGSSHSGSELGKPQSRGRVHPIRPWTNFLIFANALIFVADTATYNTVYLYWGAKVNSLIKRGQLWRLVTCSFLHSGILHLLVNLYSLNAVGPIVETICGSERFMTVYLSSAIAGSAISCRFNPNPSVGASGAIVGLMGALAVYFMRNKHLIERTDDHLKKIGEALLLTLIGGLLGGAAISWLLGPAWKVETVPPYGRVLKDEASIMSLINIFRK